MRTRILVLGGLLILLLQACSPKDDAADSRTSQAPQPELGDPAKALENARNLENDLNNAFQQRDEEIEKQSR